MLHINLQISEEEKHLRRRLLDSYGLLAQSSVLLPLLIIALYRLALHYYRPKTTTLLPPSSPYLKASRHDTSALSRFLIFERQTSWFLATPLKPLGYPLGTIGSLTLTLSWTAYLLALSFLQTGSEYLHVTKRFGIIAASQLPFHYLLSWKSPWSPISLITGLSWEELNRYHQLLGRVLLLFFSLHAGFYLNFFIQVGALGKRIRDLDVILGLLAISSLTVLGTTALKIVRKRNYRLFVVAHVSVAMLVLPILWLHVRHLRIYILEAGLVWIVGGLLRTLDSQGVPLSVSEVAGTGLVVVSAPKSELKRKYWEPGQHVYLSLGGGLWKSPTSVGRNPFTISSLRKDDSLRLVLRVQRGNTKLYTPTSRLRAEIEGPYGHADHVQKLITCDRILFVAGGVGMTFILPLYRALMEKLETSTQSWKSYKVELIWVVRSLEETAWALEALRRIESTFTSAATVKIFVTQPGSQSRGSVQDKALREREEDGIDTSDRVEMQSLLANGSMDSTLPNREGGSGIDGVEVHHGRRPDLKVAVSEVLNQSASEKVAVYACGPGGMGDQVRREAGKFVRQGRDVLFWSEEFGLS